ncbi:peptidase inhibitor family I36 protein [Couchioplanes azureus]|uniref:peptidase inhibitor family I36 protein n=1 Tax=Couchioplanes caeruleus TaxID=56438 RepID=UPI001670B840|nr:peptidase inhibitor family I36 protein [Couchioplanes caeruleus]GGQ46332.1 hypothetical protein GCM10010166_13710 [Couchioplanes caeruleus subsp. azureus]
MKGIAKKAVTRLGSTLAAAAVATTALVAVSSSPAMAAPDGYLYAWEQDNRGGQVCMWQGNDGDWSTCGVHGATTGRNMRNKASSIHNNGYSHAVRLFYTTSNTSAYACLHVGTAWFEMARGGENGPRFNLGGTNGRGALVNNNVARHSWHQTCS